LSSRYRYLKDIELKKSTMLDIIILILLMPKVRKLADRKGLKPSLWQVYTVLAWFGAELLGVTVSFFFFGDELFPAAVIGLGCAGTSYFMVQGIMQKKPDPFDDDYRNLGSDMNA
jgi:predicted membrane-bound dolichyl-phosphate-mannose-protein mannosyltransferase